LKAFDEKRIIEVARVKRDLRRDGESDSAITARLRLQLKR
jgi:hypothetical protein